MHAEATGKASAEIAKYATQAKDKSTLDFFMKIVPENVFAAFVKGEMLQVLFFAILFGAALSAMGEKGKPVEHLLEQVSTAFFGVIASIMHVASTAMAGHQDHRQVRIDRPDAFQQAEPVEPRHPPVADQDAGKVPIEQR